MSDEEIKKIMMDSALTYKERLKNRVSLAVKNEGGRNSGVGYVQNLQTTYKPKTACGGYDNYCSQYSLPI